MLLGSEEFGLHHGDCITHMAEMPAQSVDFAVFSPPFPSLYAYTSEAADIGNSEDLRGEAKLHLSFFYRQLLRVMKPGRVVMVHVAQIPRMRRSGGRGTHDFRGTNIRIGERAGFNWEYDWMIRKNPQAQAIRGKAWELKFQGIETDRAMSRGAMPDYLLKFLAPGENAVPIRDWVNDLDEDGEVIGKRQLYDTQVSRNDWIKWAEPAWDDIKETETLNGERGKRSARGEGDTKHICPLQLEVIERLIRLYTNPGEIVFSPFAGIGSELCVALKLGRRAYGCELKEEYARAAHTNTASTIRQREECQRSMFADCV
ncbi:MAG: hypothetical protein A4E20_08925 [Nitrospira sp. SG-bin2]|uniref:DNA-methyltransferase n=1 Tax=Nitrospira cf. moscoviensis SBR1015 TaxID=96242 RepID=UPI000A0DB568|nr:site-specific DNA-methyltransferase [Nitrospira cf. moscoviensis SBR1015]OQW35854.1 MAG: hypothetical protein A4E20_08925 [Nitrospira sp. SG-bin2]